MKQLLPFCAVVLILPANLLFADEREAADRPENWAQPIEQEGVPNFFRVSDDVFRSAQPSSPGMKQLQQIGVRTVINLRSFHSDRNEIGSTGLGYEHIYMKAWHPEEEDVVRFLQIVTNHNRTPVLVHCQHGADRTGLMCAIYRVAVEDWSKEEAIREMTEGGFGFHPVWKNLVTWLNDLDIERIRDLAGIKVNPAADSEPRVGDAAESKVIKNRVVRH